MENYLGENKCNSCNWAKPPFLFENISKGALEHLFANRKEVVFKKGEIIFKQGTAITHFACFCEGLARVYLEIPDENYFLINILGVGHFWDISGLFNNDEHHFTVKALTDVKLCLISIQDINALLIKNNELSFALLACENKTIMDLLHKIYSIRYKNMDAKVADVLLYLKKEIYQSNSFKLTLSRQDLGNLTALSKENINHLLKNMKDSGIIKINFNQFEIMDINALYKISRT